MAEESYRSFVSTGRSAPAPPPARTWAAAADAPAAGAAAAAPVSGIRYGDIIELQHKVTGKVLHSSDLVYIHEKTSKQNQIHAVDPSKNEPRNHWRVGAPAGLWELRGELVQDGSVVTLVNVRTGMALHSHAGYPAPRVMQGGKAGHTQQEVTGFLGGGIEVHDHSDNFYVDVPGTGGNWQAGVPVRLWHVNTKATLHSHNVLFWINDAHEERQEVTCLGGTAHEMHDDWVATVVRPLPPAAAVPKVPVCYGDVVRVRHVYAGYAPHEIHYLTAHPFHCYHHAGSSKQNQVTVGVHGRHQEWIVHPSHDVDAKSVYGRAIPDGAVVRFTELETGEALRSNACPPPSGNGALTEVSTMCHGGDANDNFRVSTEDKQGWTSLTCVRFTHVATNNLLTAMRNQTHEITPGAGTRVRSVHGMEMSTGEHNVWTTLPSPAMYLRASRR